MRTIFFVALSLCFSVCIAQRFLLSGPGVKKVILTSPPKYFNEGVEYVLANYHEQCNLNADAKIYKVSSALYQVVATGTNYEIVFSTLRYQNKYLVVNMFEPLPDKNGFVQFKINSCSGRG